MATCLVVRGRKDHAHFNAIKPRRIKQIGISHHYTRTSPTSVTITQGKKDFIPEKNNYLPLKSRVLKSIARPTVSSYIPCISGVRDN